MIKSLLAIVAFLALIQYMNNGTNNNDYYPMLYVLLATLALLCFKIIKRKMKN